MKGRDANYNAKKIFDIFNGEKNEFYEAVCLNSAATLVVSGLFKDMLNDDFKKAYEYSKSHISAGTAATHLKKIQTS